MKKSNFIIGIVILVVFTIVFVIININKRGKEELLDTKLADRREYILGIKYGDDFEKITNEIGTADRFEGENIKYPVYDLSDTEEAIILTLNNEVIFLSIEENGRSKYLMDVPQYDENNATDKLEDYNMYYNKSDCILELSDFDKIKSGYTYFDVLMTVGRPIGDCGSGRIIDVYVLKDGKVLQAFYDSDGKISKIRYNDDGNWVTIEY